MANNDNENKQVYNLAEACDYLDLSAGVIRAATREFAMTSRLHEYNPDEPIKGIAFTRDEKNHLQFTKDALDTFRTREKHVGQGPRGEGKRWLVRLTDAQKDEIQSLYPGLAFSDPYAYNKKYQKDKKAKKAEQAVE
jgi:hypothetical protein